MPSSPSKILDVFDNPNIDRDFVIRIDIPEFTCLCPKTGQPDFATLHLEYMLISIVLSLKLLKTISGLFVMKAHFMRLSPIKFWMISWLFLILVLSA